MSAICSGVTMGFGIFGCDVVRNTRRAVAVISGVLAMLRKAGPIKMRLGGRCSGSTTWQALQAARAKECPAAISPFCACALRVVAARAATRVVRRMYYGILRPLGVEVKGSATPVHPWPWVSIPTNPHLRTASQRTSMTRRSGRVCSNRTLSRSLRDSGSVPT